MPGPAVYAVVAVVSTVAVVYAFKEFIYEPHIAPRVEAWAENYIARRRARRQQRQGPVPAQPHTTSDDGSEDEAGPRGHDINTSIELERLVGREVDEWRNDVDRSQSQLRQRRTHSALDESNVSIPFVPMSPTHVLFDSSSASSSIGRTPSGTISISDLAELPEVRAATPPTAIVPTIVYPRLPTPASSRSPTPENRTALEQSVISVFQSAYSGSPSSSRPSTPLPHIASPRPESPFSDLAAIARTRSDMTSPFSLPSDADDVLSVSSAAPSMHEDEDEEDAVSLDGSWASVNGSRH
ncbi:hypothetical protein NEOLEDRAFT_1145245 [Neolentinus lepideus HHB14362 ss-1]|uniref:Uncharacterized protein n=1 Tax=Neolentinus lepideus HHB14362 ss-1 TaxID=1314782 RepID=A0A165VE76_9AGAM|nr:hypothetical protein NEOLEDRAFT_1145245 [Neolentinus lepideus HHB14362 ss-1]